MIPSKLGRFFIIATLVALPILSFARPAQGQSSNNSAGIFKAKCAVCHGAGGKGDSPAGRSLGAADLTKVAASKSEAELKAVVENGKNKMPAYGKSLKPQEIDSLIAYIKSLK